ncbi:hypothetical protein [Streptomyces sp. NPDC002082]|uniref:hypothetical protein n=1 Tax=Streptomyces sp. NPDC002082 TaxID=3154772 RepID=UPI003321B0C7
MSVVFFNGPIQNGDFVFANRPGKAAGIRIAEALNSIARGPAVPHLWNTTTLAGDLRHRAATGQQQVDREALEAATILGKYPPGGLPAAGILTDTAPAVAALALDMVTRHLTHGTLTITPVTVRACARCGHMTGTGPYPCRNCGSTETRPRTERHLIADRDPARPVLSPNDFHAHHSRPPRHLLNIATNVPQRLILSRTRSHGIDLGPMGLPGLVLDPRAALHVTVLAAARDVHTDCAAMAATQSAAANVAAYGQHFRQHEGVQLRYAVHGRIPYEDTTTLHRLYEVHRVSPRARALFEDWYLPLCSLRERDQVRPERLPSLLKFLRRATLAAYTARDPARREEVRRAVKLGDTGWITNIDLLPHVIPSVLGEPDPLDGL